MATPTLDCACGVQISAVGIVTSLKPCVPLESTTVVAQIRVVLEAPTEGLANQRPSLAKVSVHALHVHKQ